PRAAQVLPGEPRARPAAAAGAAHDAAWRSAQAGAPGPALETLLPAGGDEVPAVRWVEQGAHHVRLHAAPLSVAEAFSRYRRHGQAWIFTSATLSVHGDFSHFTSQLGLRGAQTMRWESPFDYASQGLLFVPRDLPLPQAHDFTQRFVQTLLPMLEVNPGGA